MCDVNGRGILQRLFYSRFHDTFVSFQFCLSGVNMIILGPPSNLQFKCGTSKSKHGFSQLGFCETEKVE
jgi:hypothetical protein